MSQMSCLTDCFVVDARDPAVAGHNREAREVWEAFNADRPTRVPVVFSGARSVFSDENNVDYRSYYDDPDAMARLRLQWQKRQRELPYGDTALGELPEKWSMNVDFHPVLIPSCFGCEIVFRSDAVPAHHGLNLPKERCEDIAMPDLDESGLLPRHRRFWEHINKQYTGDFRFMGRPVERAGCANMGCAGVFSLALDIRGADIMADMYDDPDFVSDFLRRLADWDVSMGRHWARVNGTEFEMDAAGGTGWAPTDHGIDMLSVEMYEKFLVPLINEVNQRFKKKPTPFLHHCGRGSHLFPTIKKHFGIERLHAVTYPLNNVARIRKELGYETWITAVIADEIITQGPPEKIRQTVKEFLSPEVKGKGRLSIWVPGEARGIPQSHYLAVYEAVKEHGRY